MSPDELRLPTPTIESDSPVVAGFVALNTAGADSDIQRATSLFYAVRDSIRYDPYQIDLSVN